MLATQINHVVTQQGLKENTLLQVDDFMRNEIQGRIVIILLKVKVLGQLSERLGDPQGIDELLKQQGGARAAPAAAAKPLYNSTNAASSQYTAPSNNSYAAPTPVPSGSPNSNPYGQRSNSTAPIVRATPAGGDAITPIAGLNMYHSRWTIRARVTTKSDIRTWSNAKGEGQLFSVELLDNSGADIKGTFFREGVDKYYNMLQTNKVYKITGGKLKIANPQWNTCKSQFEVAFDANTEIHEDADNSIGQATYQFTSIADIVGLEDKTTCDVLGIVQSVGDVAHITSRKTGQELSKCDVTLVDQSNAAITLTLWREQANNAPTQLANQPVVALRKARVSDYGGKSLGVGGSMEVNPSVEEARALLAWWTSGGNAAGGRTSLTSAGGGGSKPALADVKSVVSIKEENLGHSEKPDYISFKGTLSFIKKDREGGAWYPACPNADEPCKNRYKVTNTTDGQWQCDKCHRTYPEPTRRWIFSGVVEDPSGSTWVSFFNEQAESMLNCKADEAYAKVMEQGGFDSNAYENVFCDAQYTEWVFRARVKSEIVQEESRVKTSIANMWPVDYAAEAKAMLAEIETF